MRNILIYTLNCLMCAVMLIPAGCSFGPSVILNGRQAYGEAIAATNDQQIFSLIIRTRYGESYGLLSVASVTANVRIAGKLNADFGIGPDQNYTGNLVPLSAGVAYEENPTISYTPVEGEEYLRELLGPIPLELTLLLMRTHEGPGRSMTRLVKSINGIRNPMFLTAETPRPDPRFARVADLMTTLDRAGCASSVRLPGEEKEYGVVIHGYEPDHHQTVHELFELLGLGTPDPRDGMLQVPIRLAIGPPNGTAIQIETRSIAELARIAAASMDVPPEHIESGLAIACPPLGPVGELIRIHRSEKRPELALVAYQHRGWWYYIDMHDTESKVYFRGLDAVLSVRMADSTRGKSTAPILTVPVSR